MTPKEAAVKKLTLEGMIQIQYDYAYTSNGHQAELTERIMELLGVSAEPTTGSNDG